jgi:Zn-dependent protease with chaperone function
MGKLAAEDWKLLLAPSIIYNYVLSRDKNRSSLIRLVLPVGLGEIPLVFALLQILRLPDRNLSSELLWATVALWAIYSLSLLTLYTKWLWRSLSYTADKHAADILGREVLLSALTRYGETISATGYPRKRLHIWPTIGQRIERLQRSR